MKSPGFDSYPWKLQRLRARECRNQLEQPEVEVGVEAFSGPGPLEAVLACPDRPLSSRSDKRTSRQAQIVSHFRLTMLRPSLLGDRIQL